MRQIINPKGGQSVLVNKSGVINEPENTRASKEGEQQPLLEPFWPH
jgi:hypothetical protein